MGSEIDYKPFDKDLGSVFFDKTFLFGPETVGGSGVISTKEFKIFKKLNRRLTFDGTGGAPIEGLP